MTEPKKRKRTLTNAVIVKTRLLLEDLEYQEDKRGNRAGRIHPVWFWRCVVETLYHTGMRPNQLLHLRLKDMDLVNRLFHIRIEGSKTWREYNIPICSELIPWLKELRINAMVRDLAENDQLFNINRFSLSKRYRGEEMNAYQVSKVFQEISEKVGDKVTPVRFRHTLGTELMKTPERNLHLVKELFGHTSVKTTLGYIETDMESIRTVLEARIPVRFGL